MLIIPNSNGEDSRPDGLFYPHRRRILDLHEFNSCHTPGGPDGGQFCSKSTGSDLSVGLGRHFKERGIDPSSPPETWYPKTREASQQLEQGPLKAAADAIRSDQGRSALEKAYAGLVAEREALAHEAMERGNDSMKRNSVNGKLTPERNAFHLRIIEQYVKDQEAKRGAPITQGVHAPTTIFVGGVSGAGKSSVVGSLKNPDALQIDPDEFKAYLKKMDPALRNASASDVQRESGHIGDMAVVWAATRRMNMVVDGTMKTLGEESLGMNDHLAGRLTALKDMGYRNEVRFVDITLEQSVHRTLTRFLGQVEDGEEGRFVPPSFIRHDLKSPEHGTKPRKSFFGVRNRPDILDAWVAVDGWTGKKLGQRGTLASRLGG